MIEENYDIIYKRLIRRFIISAVILLSVFILKQFIVHYQIVQEENTSYVVNIAGRQRMLSQKIVKDISLIQLDQTILDDEIYKKDLIESLELWEKSHSELLDLNKEEPLFKNDSSSIIVNYQDLNGIGLTKYLSLPTLVAICSSSLGKPTLSSLAILGEISISGTILKVEELANVLQVCLDSGAKKVLLPITSAGELGSVPSDLVGAFSLIFYSTPQEAVFKALGVD